MIEHCVDCVSFQDDHFCDCDFWERLWAEEKRNGISGEKTLGRFSPGLFIRNLLSNCWWNLHVVSSAIGIAIILLVAGLVWFSDLLFGEQ